MEGAEPHRTKGRRSSEWEMVHILGLWRRQVSLRILSARWADTDAESLEERREAKELLQQRGLFPCVTSVDNAEDVPVTFCTSQQRPLLNDQPELARRFLAHSGQPSTPEPLYFLLFYHGDSVSTLCQPHVDDEQRVWAEYGLQRLSEVCRRHLIAESGEPQPDFVQLIRTVLRCMHAWVFYQFPRQFPAIQSSMAAALRSCRLHSCSLLDCVWEIRGRRSEAQHVSTYREGGDLYFHQRDLIMDEPSILSHMCGLLCDVACEAAPQMELPSQLGRQLNEFLQALLPFRHSSQQLLQAAELRAGGALVALSETMPPVGSLSRPAISDRPRRPL